MTNRDKLDKMCLIDMLAYLEANRTQPNACIAEMISGHECTCVVKLTEDNNIDYYDADCYECIRKILNEKI